VGRLLVAFAVTAIYRPSFFVCWWPRDVLADGKGRKVTR